jgi:hypothetical protein
MPHSSPLSERAPCPTSYRITLATVAEPAASSLSQKRGQRTAEAASPSEPHKRISRSNVSSVSRRRCSSLPGRILQQLQPPKLRPSRQQHCGRPLRLPDGNTSQQTWLRRPKRRTQSSVPNRRPSLDPACA